MHTPSTDPQVRYVAEIKGVREVTLVGAADWDYWRRRLETERLFPYRGARGAELTLSATSLRWMGFRFRELVLAVAVSGREDGSTRDGVFLAGAFNTSRMLAFCERAFFRTPYRHAEVTMTADDPVAFQLEHGGKKALHARRADGGPVATVDEQWEGPIYLPGRGERFFARLGGETAVYPWAAGRDVLELTPSSDACPVRALVDSGFGGVEWRVRRKALHARSKTYPRAT